MQRDERKKVASYYDGFLEHLKRDHDGRNPRLSHVLVQLGKIIKPGMNILDLGCGTGITSRFMAKLGASVVGIDISPKLIEYAEEHSAHPRIKYQVGDITALGTKTSRYDGVTMVDCFEHLPPIEIMQAMNSIDRQIGRDTFLFLNIPDGRYQAAAKAHIPDRLQIHDEGYRLEILLGMFASIGLEVITTEIYGIDAQCQYNTLLFRRREAVEADYQKLMCGGAEGP